MRIMVTGGAGFIGSHLVDSLICKGNEVVVLDDMSNGRVQNLNPAAQVVIGDIADAAVVSEAASHCQTIYHLASRRAVQQSLDFPLQVNDKNVGGTLAVLEVARQQNIKRVVLASSSSVYGLVTVVPTPEDAPLVPESPYAVSKLAGEEYARVYAELYGLETVRLRYFNVYGPRQDPNNRYAAVVPIFIQALMAGQTPVIHGHGEQSRAFTYVDDAVAATLAAGTAPAQHVAGNVYNVANSASYSVNHIINELQAILATQATPTHTPPRPGDIHHSLPDLSAAHRDLQWHPRFDLGDGLKSTCASFDFPDPNAATAATPISGSAERTTRVALRNLP